MNSWRTSNDISSLPSTESPSESEFSFNDFYIDEVTEFQPTILDPPVIQQNLDMANQDLAARLGQLAVAQQSMYDEVRVNNLALTVPTFSGSDFDSYKKWKESLNRYVSQVTPEIMRKIMLRSLDASALTYFLERTIDPLTQELRDLTTTELLNLLDDRYLQMHNRYQQRQDLLTAVQNQYESPSAFAERLLRIAKIAYPPNELITNERQKDLLDNFIRGLANKTLRMRLIQRNDANFTFQNAVDEACKYESAQKVVSSSNGKSVSFDEQSEFQQLNQRLDDIALQMNQIRDEPTNYRASVRQDFRKDRNYYRSPSRPYFYDREQSHEGQYNDRYFSRSPSGERFRGHSPYPFYNQRYQNEFYDRNFTPRQQNKDFRTRPGSNERRGYFSGNFRDTQNSYDRYNNRDDRRYNSPYDQRRSNAPEQYHRQRSDYSADRYDGPYDNRNTYDRRSNSNSRTNHYVRSRDNSSDRSGSQNSRNVSFHDRKNSESPNRATSREPIPVQINSVSDDLN